MQSIASFSFNEECYNQPREAIKQISLQHTSFNKCQTWSVTNCLCSFAGFPLQKGRHIFENVPTWADDHCKIIRFEPYKFYPHQKVYVQLTVNHVNYSDSTFVHEATIPWVESVNSTQFTACVTRAGRNDYPLDSFATIDWIAHQGAPPGGVAGQEKFSRWWTGTKCQTVTLPNVSVPFLVNMDYKVTI